MGDRDDFGEDEKESVGESELRTECESVILRDAVTEKL